MDLVQLLLPLADNDGNKFPDDVLRAIQKMLYDRFGGVTAYSRAPAKGIWKSGGEARQDDIVIVEVMADQLDKHWWRQFRRQIEKTLAQDETVIRAHEFETL